jgi:hypothetical protein
MSSKAVSLPAGVWPIRRSPFNIPGRFDGWILATTSASLNQPIGFPSAFTTI